MSQDLYKLFRLEELSKVASKGSVWEHKKTETLYMVRDLVLIEATLTVAISYSKVSEPQPVIWVRPIDEFLDGRFERVQLFKEVESW